MQIVNYPATIHKFHVELGNFRQSERISWGQSLELRKTPHHKKALLWQLFPSPIRH